jgi:hypothetical protein
MDKDAIETVDAGSGTPTWIVRDGKRVAKFQYVGTGGYRGYFTIVPVEKSGSPAHIVGVGALGDKGDFHRPWHPALVHPTAASPRWRLVTSATRLVITRAPATRPLALGSTLTSSRGE